MLKYLLGAFLAAAVARGQVVGAGYSLPAPISAAPGQILTLYVDNAAVSGLVRAPAGQLPTTLGGFTVTLRQGTERPVPILEVRPVSMCPGVVMVAVVGQPSCATLAAITVQIPYELIALCPPCARPEFLTTLVVVSAAGAPGTVILVTPLADQVHILTSCDGILQPLGSVPPVNLTGLPCAPMVTHADGSMVSATNPAKVGETLVAWAFGLGQTNPAASTGTPASASVPIAQALMMDWDYTVNALPVKPFARRATPLYAGLVPGYAGLYQINFVVPPEAVAGTPRCGSSGIQSNLTMSFGAGFSFDGAGICVATRIPID